MFYNRGGCFGFMRMVMMMQIDWDEDLILMIIIMGQYVSMMLEKFGRMLVGGWGGGVVGKY